MSEGPVLRKPEYLSGRQECSIRGGRGSDWDGDTVCSTHTEHKGYFFKIRVLLFTPCVGLKSAVRVKTQGGRGGRGSGTGLDSLQSMTPC